MKNAISVFVHAVAGLAMLFIISLGAGRFAMAQQEKVLHSFIDNGIDGYYPVTNLGISDNLVGTTSAGGSSGLGTVFRVNTENGDEAVIHNFSGGSDGADPTGALGYYIPDGTYPANYGTTSSGGANNLGTVYLLAIIGSGGAGGGMPPGSKVYEGVKYSFDGKHGANPYGGLSGGPDANLFGTTVYGGAYNMGTVFQFTHKTHRFWEVHVLHNFGNSSTDGFYPYATLIPDAAGNLYGTTPQGGANSFGTVFEMVQKTGGGWAEKVLYSFNSKPDGNTPYASLIFDTSGNLYGTTFYGGTFGYGTVFELMPAGGGSWTETVIHDFDNNGTDGALPFAGLSFDSSGNLYGTTELGGTAGFGTVFELTPAGGGSWTETILHSFANTPDGSDPIGGVSIDTSTGIIYGTTEEGGDYGYGTVYKIMP